jgi:hypothetical protein
MDVHYSLLLSMQLAEMFGRVCVKKKPPAANIDSLPFDYLFSLESEELQKRSTET